MILPGQITIREVGPRDGLQAEKEYVDTQDKIKLINRILACGINQVEATSFVNPRAIPQLRDAEKVILSINRPAGTTISALVGNARGVERALAAGVDEVQVVISVSESHNKRNMNMSIQESLRQLEKTMQTAEGSRLVIRAAAAVAFGCPFEGEMALEKILGVVNAYRQIGIRQVTLADTAGLGNPKLVYRVVNEVKNRYPGLELALHFHDTRGLGLANVLAGLQAGVAIMESSIGGLGGCPFIPRATGNIATEDLVNMCESMGVSTGVNLECLLDSARWLEGRLNRKLNGRMLQIMDAPYACAE